MGHERELKLQAYDRLEGLRVEMRALEGKDMKSDLWKDKCRELFDICKDLERENDDLIRDNRPQIARPQPKVPQNLKDIREKKQQEKFNNMF